MPKPCFGLQHPYRPLSISGFRRFLGFFAVFSAEWGEQHPLTPGQPIHVQRKLRSLDGLRLPLDEILQFALSPGISLCILHVRGGPDGTSEGLLLRATVLPTLDPHRHASGYWQGACGVLEGGRFALIVRCRASRSTRGTCQAKEYSENMMVNTLPSNTKEKLCHYYSPRF